MITSFFHGTAHPKPVRLSGTNYPGSGGLALTNIGMPGLKLPHHKRIT